MNGHGNGPPDAEPGDDRVYAAAEGSRTDDADTDRGGAGGESERAARDLDTDGGSEPTRSG